MLKNLTIKTRLIFVIAFLSCQLVVGGVIGIVSLAFTNGSMQSMYDDRLVPTGQLDQVIRLMTANQLTVAKAITTDPARAKQLMDEVESNEASMGKYWQAYMSTRLTPEENALADHFVASREKFVTEALKPAVAALRANQFPTAAEILHGPMEKLFQPVRADINKLIEIQLTIAKQEFDESQSLYKLVRNSCIAGILFGLALAAFVGAWLVRAITVPINHAVKLAGGIAKGDLTQQIEVTTSDETGRLMQALKDMNSSLVTIVSEVRTSTDSITTAATQISAGNLDLSSRTEQQASSLEETASSMEELTGTVKQNADNALQANTLASSASEVAVKGGAVMSQVVDTMKAIDASSQKISDIIGVIDGIAFQTNILALNAAVEAARAGEQGRGFAVVASEVRSLAQRSGAAAKEIKDLITESVEKVHAGTALVDQAGATMQDIVESVKRVTDIMSGIAAASHEQTTGIEQVNQAITQLDQVTQQNASLVEEAAATSEAMQDQAATLAQVVSVFKVDGRLAASAEPMRHATRVRAVEKKAPPKAAARLAAPQPKRLANVKPSASSAGGDWEEF